MARSYKQIFSALIRTICLCDTRTQTYDEFKRFLGTSVCQSSQLCRYYTKKTNINLNSVFWQNPSR
ncbi:hypothetical protein BpHYR1_036571 [Brachionus plicatilis]|uniref:Uncharacterized protein n=1 Tax=Brachionus plicatilis TaxID=10195 RepID=A0A3M7PXR5_BRAPC|nr:hypothetical protein BpHYR1_036571 [Brachionus plicatilis]